MEKVNYVLLITFFTSIVMVFLPTSSYACSCAEPPTVKDAQAQPRAVIFSGKVSEIDQSKDFLTQSSAEPVGILFEVQRSWQNINNSEAIVYTAKSSASCGYEFNLQEEYLVYAYEHDGKLKTNICSRTTTLATAQSDLYILGKGQPPIEQTNLKPIEENNARSYLLWLSLVAVIVVIFIFYRKRVSK